MYLLCECEKDTKNPKLVILQLQLPVYPETQLLLLTVSHNKKCYVTVLFGPMTRSPCWMSFQRTQNLELSSKVTKQLCLGGLT